MKFKLGLACLIFVGSLLPAAETGNLTVDRALQIPGNTLKPGNYTLAVEDRLRGRAILRLSNSAAGQSFLLLAAPNPKLPILAGNPVTYFRSPKHIRKPGPVPLVRPRSNSSTPKRRRPRS